MSGGHASYRELLAASLDGESVSDFELAIWRTEETLIRSRLFFLRAYRDCGLLPGHFSAPMHKTAWEALDELGESMPDADAVKDVPALLDALRRKDARFEGARGQQWTRSLLSERPVEPDYGLQTLARELQQHHANNGWASRFAQLGKRVGQDPNVAGLQGDFVRAALDVASEDVGASPVTQSLDAVEWNAYERENVSVIPTGNPNIDEAAGGGHGKGEMLVWGGGTGDGKSYAAQRLLRDQARLGNSVLYISCEDPAELMFCRMVADYCGASPHDIRTRNADPRSVESARQLMREELHGLAYLIELKKCTVSEIEQAIRLYRYALGVKMVIVDYLQAVRADDDSQANNKVTETSHIVSRLKRAASDAGVALVLFSQYSRESYKGGQEPGLNACKYCGDIENESEVMVLMWRDPEGTLHAKIAKTKWSAAGNRRFIVPVDSRTGCHLPWEPDQSEVE